MILPVFQTSDGNVYRRIETARRQEELLEAIEAERMRRFRQEASSYFEWCERVGACPACGEKYQRDGDCACPNF
jgi:hypothetical protein